MVFTYRSYHVYNIFCTVTVTAAYITLVAVVGRFVLDPTLIGNLLAFGHQLVSQDLDVLHGLQQAVSVNVKMPLIALQSQP